MTSAIRARTADASPSWRRRRRFAAAVTVALCALAACGGGERGHDGSAGTEPPSAQPTCDDGTLNERAYVLCTAGEAPDQPLIVALHGRGSSADEMRAATALHRNAADAGLAVVYPDARDGGWGDDTFTSPARPHGDEDVVFLDALIGRLRADPRLDDGPIGLVGFSNGASMALRYASDRPDDVTAVVAVAGQLPRDPDIRPAGRVPLLLVYGSADPIRPYGTGIPDNPRRRPGDPTPTLPTPDTVAAFVARATGPAHHQGPAETDPQPADGTRLRTERWTDRNGTLAVLHTIVGGGHTWPSARRPFAGAENFGATSRDIDASSEAVNFVLDPDDGT